MKLLAAMGALYLFLYLRAQTNQAQQNALLQQLSL